VSAPTRSRTVWALSWTVREWGFNQPRLPSGLHSILPLALSLSTHLKNCFLIVAVSILSADCPRVFLVIKNDFFISVFKFSMQFIQILEILGLYKLGSDQFLDRLFIKLFGGIC
jgi:hypothetical protein